MDKINVYDKIMTENQKKRENMEIKEMFYIVSPKRWLRNGIQSLLMRADARGTADIICRI